MRIRLSFDEIRALVEFNEKMLNLLIDDLERRVSKLEAKYGIAPRAEKSARSRVVLH
jgi:hypothetical protein